MDPLRYHLVIFDFDGTLADSWRVMGQAIIEAADEFGYRRLTADEAQHLRGLPNREIMQALGVRAWQLPRIGIHMRRVAAAHADRIPLFAGIDALLRDLHRAGVTIAVVSSNAEATIRQVLGPALADLVSHFACGASLFGKASKFRRVVRAAGVAPTQALAVGDEARDIEAATAAGIDAGAVTWGYATADLLTRCTPAHICTTVEELGDLLMGGARALPPSR